MYINYTYFKIDAFMNKLHPGKRMELERFEK